MSDKRIIGNMVGKFWNTESGSQHGIISSLCDRVSVPLCSEILNKSSIIYSSYQDSKRKKIDTSIAQHLRLYVINECIPIVNLILLSPLKNNNYVRGIIQPGKRFRN